jgi:nitrogen fixation NifU-like protein
MNSLYHAYLLQHYKKPLNHESIQDHTFERLVLNHLCGDQAIIKVLLVDHCIKGVSIQTKGCVISIASASILSEYIKSRSCCELIKLNSGMMLDLIGIPLGPVRIKCALLSFDAIMQGLQEYCCKR